ncbi:store-operated calcium entry regulator STIMATE isoform X3 [Manis javanica]|uniref:store-operated calcium entry regulator STIMATE isoform X3 n=1 Tax=Manis javanica TaxID=9974 RepID=UPI003C6D3679
MQGPAGNASRALPGGPPSTAAAGAGRCESGALMHSFGIFLQGLLGVVAFSTLMRTSSTSSWMPPWACCSSTQVCAPSASWWSGSSGSPCASASMGRGRQEQPGVEEGVGDGQEAVCCFTVSVSRSGTEGRTDSSTVLEKSTVGDPLRCGAWAGQCALYIVIVVFEKSVVFLVLLILQWKKVALLNPIENPDLKLAIVMLIVPFFVNALMFWVVDNFLMRKGRTKAKLEERGANQDARSGSKVRYRRAASHEESESEILISADDEMEESDAEDDLRGLPPPRPAKKKKHLFGLPV